MAFSRTAALIWTAVLVALLAVYGWRDRPSLRGIVLHDGEPVASARVRWQGSSDAVRTDEAGRFCLHPSQKPVALTAWKEGFRIASLEPRSPRPRLTLSRLPLEDNHAYSWLPPDPDVHNDKACGNCHQTIHEEWSKSSHAGSAKNPRLLSLISGLDSSGKTHARWNVSSEHPLGVGVCSRCHAPTMRSPDLDYDLRKVTGVAAHGVHCDLCHKVVDVPTDKLGTRFGIDALTLLRPHGDEQLFFGPLEDAVREGESFGHFPLYKESRYCAGCHEGTVFGVKAYTTYSEWLESPAAKRGIQCQHCHMTPTGTLTNIAPGKGGIERDPLTLASHAMPGASRDMLKKSVRCDVRLEHAGDRLRVEVALRAENVGHRVPTGFIDRHLVLLVQAWDKAGNEVANQSGPRLTTGLGDPWAGRAGWIYGRWLIDEHGNTPQPFWIPPDRERDTRLWPEKTDVRAFEFPGAIENIRVQVVYRKFWPEVMQSRGWQDQQFTLHDQTYETGPRR